jgi:hypothetical protein
LQKNEAAKGGIKAFDPVFESRISAARVTTGFKFLYIFVAKYFSGSNTLRHLP